MRQYYRNALISALLKRQMCFIECHTTPRQKLDITSFEPEPGKYCQARCWQNWASAEKLKIFGLEAITKDINDWGIEIHAFLRASYDHYTVYKFKPDPSLPSVDQLYHDEVTPVSGSYLPVCDSHIGPYKQNHFSGIPCMCGDKYGTETDAFWTAANFPSWKYAQVGNFETRKGPPYLCKNDMSIAQTAPVPYFLNLCFMGWRWPTQLDLAENPDARWLHRGFDLHCADFFQEVQTLSFIGPDQPDLDCYMCFESKIGQKIQDGDESQLLKIDNQFKPKFGDPHPYKQNYNFHRACEVFEENHGKCYTGSSHRVGSEVGSHSMTTGKNTSHY
ncbi:MAG: hypothetical protein Q9220_001163 [cf. Caloplaca sp. 1 TL-2023]